MNFTNKRKNCELQNVLRKLQPTRPIPGEVLDPFCLAIQAAVYKDIYFCIFVNMKIKIVLLLQ
jgi:hypothetical protein